MGFLDFLKRQKPNKVEFEDLDLPPAPPPLEKYDQGIGAEQDLMPELPPYQEDTLKHSADQEQFELPDMAGSEEMPLEEEKPELPSIQYGKPEAQQAQPEYPMEEIRSVPVSYSKMPDRRIRRHLPKSSYVNLNDLKDVLIGIKGIRNDLGVTQDTFMVFENVRMKQDKTYEKLNSISHDLQKKLIYMDKNLFKGEKA